MLGHWNELLLEAVMRELVPDLLVTLKDTLRPRFHLEPSSLYRFWPFRRLLPPGPMATILPRGPGGVYKRLSA